MKATEMRDKSTGELRELVLQWREELFRTRMHLYTGQLENTAELRTKRRDIARALTLIRQREISEAQA